MIGRLIDAQQITLLIESPADLGPFPLPFTECFPPLLIVAFKMQKPVQLTRLSIVCIRKLYIGRGNLFCPLWDIDAELWTLDGTIQRLQMACGQLQEGTLASPIRSDDRSPDGGERE
ncbi:hypothetical protein SDC9_122008 [bioreactor metagenome]|uniref:Uncharacterized protein n=1 Tax=bioreactor metagenome TaxID=1076179 RepID=A0A645CDJ6_9ZZZZ